MNYTFTELHFEQIIDFARKAINTNNESIKHSYMEIIEKIAQEYIKQDDEKRIPK